jgi:hypothetical protein
VLQILGVVLGAVILQLGLTIIVGWRPTRRRTVVASRPGGTTVVEETTPVPPSQAT